MPADDFDRARCARHHGLRHAAEQQPLDPGSSVGSDNDEIGVPLSRLFDDGCRWVALARHYFHRSAEAGEPVGRACRGLPRLAFVIFRDGERRRGARNEFGCSRHVRNHDRDDANRRRARPGAARDFVNGFLRGR